MMIVMRPTATVEEVEAVVERVHGAGARAHVVNGEELTVIGAIGDPEHVARLALDGMPGVDHMLDTAHTVAAAGADGLIVEVHPNPDEAICDAAQQLVADEFSEYLDRVRAATALAGKALFEEPVASGR
jgi:hypothetical protein